jgi:hypothetical protein
MSLERQGSGPITTKKRLKPPQTLGTLIEFALPLESRQATDPLVLGGYSNGLWFLPWGLASRIGKQQGR